MKNRKYDYYEVATSDGNGAYNDYTEYREAFAVYQMFRSRRTSDSHATLWGVNDMGEYTCIMAF